MKKGKWSYLISLMFFLLIYVGSTILNAKVPSNLKITIKTAITQKPGLLLSWSYQKPYSQTTQVNYKIERRFNNSAWKEIMRPGSDRRKRHYLDQYVAPNVNYCYRVKVSTHSSWSNHVCLHTPSIPSAPKNLKGQIKYPQPGRNEFIIDWQDQANNEEGFEVKYKGIFGKTKYLIPNSYYFSMIKEHHNCPPVTFKVRAYNLCYSPYATVTLDAAPNPIPSVQNFKTNFINHNKIGLSWSNPAPYSSMRIERKDLGTTGLRKKGFYMNPKFKNIRFISPANNTTQYIDNTTKPQSKYIYRIEVYYNNCRAYSKLLEVKTPNLPKRIVR